MNTKPSTKKQTSFSSSDFKSSDSYNSSVASSNSSFFTKRMNDPLRHFKNTSKNTEEEYDQRCRQRYLLETQKLKNEQRRLEEKKQEQRQEAENRSDEIRKQIEVYSVMEAEIRRKYKH